MSNINTNNINVNYPTPGVNNSTQGFRDNFSSIKTNLDTAATEISALQNSVVVKSAIGSSVVDNDMANTIISNAAIRTFRSTTYNLGTNISGILTVDVTDADVQYGSLSANTTLQFTGWTPATTCSNIQLQLDFSGNTNAVVTFPTNVVVTDNNWGATIVENANTSSGALQVSVPHGVTRLDYVLSTKDCGGNILVTPVNRPQKSTQITSRTPLSTGAVGDTAGTICHDSEYYYICVANYDGVTPIWRRIPLNSY